MFGVRGDLTRDAAEQSQEGFQTDPTAEAATLLAPEPLWNEHGLRHGQRWLLRLVAQEPRASPCVFLWACNLVVFGKLHEVSSESYESRKARVKRSCVRVALELHQSQKSTSKQL